MRQMLQSPHRLAVALITGNIGEFLMSYTGKQGYEDLFRHSLKPGDHLYVVVPGRTPRAECVDAPEDLDDIRQTRRFRRPRRKTPQLPRLYALTSTEHGLVESGYR